MGLFTDNTPILDFFGDKSTVGFERLFTKIYKEVNAPQLYATTHTINPLNNRCRKCGFYGLEIHRHKLPCQTQ